MWFKYWVLILLALLIGIVSYSLNDPTVGWKVAALCDLIWWEIVSLIDQIWTIITGLLQGR